jgi:hypothetical protein
MIIMGKSIISTASVDEVDWQYIGSVTPLGTKLQDLSVSHVLPSGGSTTQAVRVNFCYKTPMPAPTHAQEEVGMTEMIWHLLCFVFPVLFLLLLLHHPPILAPKCNLVRLQATNRVYDQVFLLQQVCLQHSCPTLPLMTMNWVCHTVL